MPKISELPAATGTEGTAVVIQGGVTKKGTTGTAAGSATTDFAPAAAVVYFRRYDAVTGWPIRGSIPVGAMVWWINSVNSTPPTAGGDGYLDTVDIITVVAA